MRFLRLTPLCLILLTGFSLFLPSLSNAQPNPTSADALHKAIDKREALRETSLIKQYPVRSIGPVVMSGRVSDLAVNEDNPTHFLVAYASGGLFETTNNGNSFTPIFDNEGALTIGDIAWSQSNKNIIWVGTGENNSSRSSYAGSGLYKSVDGGESWSFMGLPNSQHIGRIIIHPENPDIVWVASMGALYSYNDQRGIYKTTDGGNTWKKTLFVDDKTGGIDLIINPDNADELWASMWQRYRQAWNFEEAGKGSAIWHSTDGGESWNKSEKGLPEHNQKGRLGLAVSQQNPDVLYALLDNQFEEKTEKEAQPDTILTFASFSRLSVKDIILLEDSKLEDFLRQNGFAAKYTAAKIKELLNEEEITPDDIANYSGDANEALFNTSVKGAEVYRSEDGGKTWRKTHEEKIGGLYYTYGYYFGEIRLNPADDDHLFIMGVPMLESKDGGKTWSRSDKENVHVDHQAMWINPDNPDHMLLGNDGGLYSTYDGGEIWEHHNSPAVGQFYTVQYDMETPYNVYGGLQDNGVFYGSSAGTANDGNEWQRLMGGDGMHIAVHPDNSDIVYTGFQFGNYYRIDQETESYSYITPKHDIGDDPYRFNWNTPLIMSRYNPDILYLGSQYLLRTLDGGETWNRISPDLTTNKKPQGNVPYSTITTISESHFDFGVIWVGTDDGNLYLTKDGGVTWKKRKLPAPDGLWVSKVEASPHNPAEAFVSLTGYRYDHFKTYLYKTSDWGKNWKSVKGDLPDEAMNVLLPDPVQEGLLFAGSDHATYMSTNGGENWHLFGEIPNVASYDIKIHPRDHELIVGTHGRSIYTADLKPLRRLAQQGSKQPILAEVNPIIHSRSWGEEEYIWSQKREPEVDFVFFNPVEDANVKLKITSIDEENDFEQTIALSDVSSGFQSHRVVLYDSVNDQYPAKGSYTVSIIINDNSDLTDEQPLKIRSRNQRPDAMPRNVD